MSRRNLGMLRWAEGPRRSTRISALNARKAQKTRKGMGGALEGPASACRTRGARRKRKLQAVEDTEDGSDDLPSQEDQPEGSPNDEEHDTETGQQSIVPSATKLPEKQMLELVLDTLQKRDTYEIFAQPVDPNEVENYYEIIEEPMDFGTMRAKLHEVMYENLQQFEHDAFLITKNAMHFNSSSTMYFRQARAIHELTKKVFHLLKTNPEEFKRQFSDTRRRSTRKLTKPENCRASFSSKSYRKATSNTRSGGAVEHEPSKSTHCFFSPMSRTVQIGSTLGEATDGRRESDRRSTYRSWRSMLTESSSIFMDAMSNSMQPINQQEISYAESLMSFAKNLGPTAQKVAQKKLQGLGLFNADPYGSIPTSEFSSFAPKTQAHEVSTSIQLGSHDKSDAARSPLKPLSLRDRPQRRPVVLGCTTSKLCSGLIDARKKATPIEQKSSLSRDFPQIIGQKIYETDSPVIPGVERASGQLSSYPFHTKNQTWTSEAASEIYRADNYNSGNDETIQNLSHPWLQRNVGNLQNMSLAMSHREYAHAGPSHLTPPTPQFKFDLPYLKMKLDQMKSVEQERLVYNSGFCIPSDLFTNESIYQGDLDREAKDAGFGGYRGNQQGSFDDGYFEDLALQL
ncbi:uncharacterized protein LOC116200759 isoform X2 [Punica granatum]|uniref:Uncharacterized protein LOC116200759 isoform X2 n=1 Tax=Punica granatum TaxID=22663 RepID=A0A6P8D899_PUNGR|nr:uncharacterized protein LOC116200759 isoform X2 [Punica granatum]